MQVKILAESTFQIVGIVSGDGCEAEAFLRHGEETTKSSRSGLLAMLAHVAEVGPQGLVAAWTHEVSKKDKIYEFSKGSLRLFYFKGEGRQIVVCTSGGMKKQRKVDKAAVKKAAVARQEYLAAHSADNIEVIGNEAQ